VTFFFAVYDHTTLLDHHVRSREVVGISRKKAMMWLEF
jgi:hypothetical protein